MGIILAILIAVAAIGGWSIGWNQGFHKGFLSGKANVLDRLEESTGRAVEEGEFPRELEG